MRLFSKLLLSFLAIALLGVIIVSYLANQITMQEVRGLMVNGDMTDETALTQELAGYYRGHGSWEGVETLLNNPMGAMMGQRLLLVDTEMRVVADSLNASVGQIINDTNGTPILVEGKQVGALLVRGRGLGMMAGQGQGRAGETVILGRVNQSILLAGLAAVAAAVVLGGFVAYGLVRPIRQLTQATSLIARGDLAHRVEVKSQDEIGELAHAFNKMAGDLQSAERLRRDMTADIAHELRNPLAVLQSNVEGIVDGVLPPSPENLQPLLEQTQLLTRLVDDLRTLALADAGQLPLHKEETDLVALARSVVTHFTAPADSKAITLTVDLSSGLPLVSADSQRLTQVLSNLLSNALRHTPAGGEIKISLQKQNATLVLSVVDTGSGIAPDALPFIFDRFYRADKSRTRAEGGTGLGLAIAKQIVEAHSGKIWAESQVGKGTQVSFALPLANF